jgi:predicted transcriptional regulator
MTAERLWSGPPFAVEVTVEYPPHMSKAVQIMLDDETLRAADQAARKAKVNRSELFRRALALYLERARVQRLEDRHRAGYAKRPERADEFGGFEGAWPKK